MVKRIRKEEEVGKDQAELLFDFDLLSNEESRYFTERAHYESQGRTAGQTVWRRKNPIQLLCGFVYLS